MIVGSFVNQGKVLKKLAKNSLMGSFLLPQFSVEQPPLCQGIFTPWETVTLGEGRVAAETEEVTE